MQFFLKTDHDVMSVMVYEHDATPTGMLLALESA